LQLNEKLHSLIKNFKKFGKKILQEILSNWSTENNQTLTKEILDIPESLQQGILKDVRANCFCASLLRTQIHATSLPRHA